MKRPEFVSNEDIARWSDNIDNDVSIPKFLAEMVLMREVMYAGLWLAEQLRKEKCSEELIPRIQFAMGGLSFGRDPWEVAQEVFKAYQDNDLEFEIDYNEDA